MRVRKLGGLLLFLQLLAVAFCEAARSQTTLLPAPVVRLNLPAAVEVGRTAVPATLQLDTGANGLSIVTAITFDPRSGGSIVVSPTANGSGPACEGYSFAVIGPDATGRYVFSSPLPVLLLPLVTAACTIHFTFDVVAGVPGGQVIAEATLTALPLAPLLADTATGQAAMAVIRPMPTVRTTADSPTTPLGASVGSVAAVTADVASQGQPAPTGSVIFRLYGPDDPSCAEPPAFTSDPVPLDGGGASSPSFDPRQLGPYRWTADYEGDETYEPSDSTCDDPAAATMVVRPTGASSPSTSLPVTTTTVGPKGGASSVPPPTTAPPSTSPAPDPLPPPSADEGPAEYDPADHASEVVDNEIGAFVLLSIVAGAAGGRKSKASASSGGGDAVSTQVGVSEQGVVVLTAHALARGDRSRTWRWPGTKSIDKLSLTFPLRVANVSPLLARITDDASYLRAMLGSVAVIAPLAAVALGVLAVGDVHGEALPPAFPLFIAIAVLGVVDAAAGVVAVTVFVAGVVVFGGLSSTDAARTLVVLAVLWFAAPIIAGASRPLLRDPTTTAAEHWDRLADIVIASLIGAWAVQQFLQALPILSGRDLDDAKRADEAALIVLAALAARMIVETIAAHWYPHRLSCVQPRERPGSWRGQRLTAKVLTLALFVFVAASYVGHCWQLYVGGVLFIVPQILEFAADRFPNHPTLYTWLPHGIVQIVLMLLIGGFVGALAGDVFPNGRDLVRWSFLMLSIPGFVLSMLGLFGREGPERRLLWRHQMLGVLVLALGVLLVLGVVGP